MDAVARVKVFEELFDLIAMYYEERDQPGSVPDFFQQVKSCCDRLDLDFEELIRLFDLHTLYGSFRSV